ncbi:MAG TPA: AAA family ATPase [Ktedonobacteraceae bacterium]|nr:AAA family ATPase [Ktedonobacteraceae bacterium]
MDVVQFGRWISERRRKYGWSSQRALADTARHDPILADCRISEDFLARLEAGRLAHPFRGNARKQVLALAWLLCKTPRDVKIYLNVAELAELSADEAEQMERLREYLMIRRTPAVLLLSARPSRLIGHAQALHELTSTLCTMETGLCAITGMPGVGKSALAHEALHVLASNDRMHVFPDGIVTFSCTKRHGEQGLIALLQEISAVFSQQRAGTARIKHGTASKSTSKKAGNAALPESQGLQSVAVAAEPQLGAQHTTTAALADAIDHARMALMDKSVLILLDDLDACFPLRRALEALLGHSQHTTSGGGGRGLERVRRVVLTTGCYVPPTALVAHRIQLGPLKPEAALELFASLMHVSLTRISAQNRAVMEQICAAVGYLPLAIEVAVNAITVKGIPLALLAARVGDCPLDSLLDGDGVLRSAFERALANFTPELRKQFSLLTTLGVTTFGLECAAAILGKRSNEKTYQVHPAALSPPLHASVPIAISLSYSHKTLSRSSESSESVYDHHDGMDDDTVGDIVDVPISQLANTAATLGLFAGHSLLELIAVPAIHCSLSSGTRYRLHPLLYAYAQTLVEQVDLQEIHAARRNGQFYAEAYLECFQGDITKRECLPQQT